MPPADLIPATDPIPVPWGWFQVLLTVTFVLHVVFMNLMLGGAIIAFAGSLRGRDPGLDAAREASRKLPFAVAFAVNAGVAPLLFLQVLYGHLVYTSSILIAGWWLSIIGVLIVAYYGVYLYRFRFDAWAAARAALSGLVVLLLLFVAFLFTNNMTLALTPAAWTAYFDRPDGGLLNLGEPTLWPRYLHMVVGSVAVAGLGLAAFARARGGQRPEARGRVAHGLTWFSWATVLQMVLGIWWLIALPREVMLRFMGRDPAASAALVVGVGLAIVALVFGFRRQVWPAVGAAVATLLVMAILREFVRAGYLAGVFHPRQLEVVPQASPLILFLAVFAVGIGCVWYMLKLAARAGREA